MNYCASGGDGLTLVVAAVAEYLALYKQSSHEHIHPFMSQVRVCMCLFAFAYVCS